MSVLRFLFVDQMSETLSALDGLTRSDTIMFFESLDDFKTVNHHKKGKSPFYSRPCGILLKSCENRVIALST